MSPSNPRPELETAQHVLSLGQKILLWILIAAVVGGFVVNQHLTAISLIACAMVFWIVFVGFKIVLWRAGTKYRYIQHALVDYNDPSLPTFTAFVPLFNEAQMVAKLARSVNKLQYPKDKLQVLLLLEDDDEATWQAAEAADLPAYFELVRLPPVPPGGLRTKPKALNAGLSVATGTYSVIYDAEDRPEPDQLLKAVSTFRHQRDKQVACLQARLCFWNEETNLLTRFYWSEYVIHFQWVLAGLARFGLIPPLGGTSNIFLTEALREIGGWDAYNVTEDADIAPRLARKGYRIVMLDSTTYEEATAHPLRADRQRRRWLKGYAQTGLVHTRKPLEGIRQMGLLRWFFFNLLMLGTLGSYMLNPFFWGATIVYFATRTTVIERLFPLPLYYTGILLMVVGNLLLFYQLVIACIEQEGYGSVKYMLLAPLWWMFTTWSAYMAIIELIFHPHHWHKTQHGHDLQKEDKLLHLEQIA